MTELIVFQAVGLYFLMGFWHLIHNRRMGSQFTGIIVAILWPVTPVLWCLGWVAEYMHETHLKRIIKESNDE